MEASNVYYTDFRCPVGTSLLEKLRRLCLAAGIRQLDMEGKFVSARMNGLKSISRHRWKLTTMQSTRPENNF